VPNGESKTPQTFKIDYLEENGDILNTQPFRIEDETSPKPSAGILHQTRTETKQQRHDLFGSGIKETRSKGSAKKSLNSHEKS
jgi:hypothetical protein